MKSYDVIDWGKPLQARTRDAPVPRGTEVLLRLTHCGVCHTDVHVRDGYYDLGGGKKLSLADRGLTLPLTLGHEPVGEVAAIGDAVRDIVIGKRYLINPWIGCGSCAMCAADRDNLCQAMRPLGMGAWGGFGTHLLVRHAKYLVDIEGLEPDRAAPLACSGLTTYSAIKKLLPIDAAEWVAVIGCGGLGLMALAVLRGLGHNRAVACDIDDVKLAAARASGAPETCNLRTEGLKRLLQVAGGSVCGVLDFVGSPETVALAVPALRKGGRFVVSGLMGGTASVPIPVMALREIAIMGSAVGNTPDLVDLVALAKRGRIRLPEVERRPLSMADRSLEDLAAGRVVGRVVLEVNETA
jgi:D-arabinose 1-dehydrogenase-like Zn-dependent alcohol dehydrogenase